MSKSKIAKTWEEHWASDDTPWDAGDASPSLKDLVRGRQVTPGARALVPGCGSGYDVFCLAQAGYSSVGLDLAESARPRFEQLRAAQDLTEAQARLMTNDFFQLSPDELGGPFDFIWDYTFYCAIEPQQREAWKTQMLRLLAPGGTLAMLLFPVVQDAPSDQGPPYPLDPEKIAQQLAPELKRSSLQAATSSHPGREGKEWLALFE